MHDRKKLSHFPCVLLAVLVCAGCGRGSATGNASSQAVAPAPPDGSLIVLGRGEAVGVVGSPGSWQVLKGGEPVGGRYAWVGRPVPQSGGDSVVFRAKSADRWIIIKDGVQVGREYVWAGDPVFSPDGRSIACAARVADEKMILVKDGEVASQSYDDIINFAWANGGASLVAAVWLGGKSFVVKDGQRVSGEFDGIADLHVTLDSHIFFRAWAYRPGGSDSWQVLKDNVPIGPACGHILLLVLSPDGRSVAFEAASGTLWFIVLNLNGTRVGEHYEQVSPPVFSPDGRSVAFVARRGGKWFVMKNGRRVNGEFDDVSEITTAPDGSLVFAGRKGKRLHRVAEPW